MNLPESILDTIVEYNNQQATIDNLLELNQSLLHASTFLSLVEENQLELVKTAVRYHPNLCQTHKEALDIALQNKNKEMILFLVDNGFDKPNHPIICDIARTEDVDFQLSMFSDTRLNLNKLYVGEACTIALHEFDALSFEAFQIIINRPDYMCHNHVCPNAEPFLFFCVDTHHELHGYQSIKKAELLIKHSKTDVSIKYEGRSLLDVANKRNIIDLLHEKMVQATLCY